MRKIKHLIALSVALVTLSFSSLTALAYPGGDIGGSTRYISQLPCFNEYELRKLGVVTVDNVPLELLLHQDTNTGHYCKDQFDEFGNVIITSYYGGNKIYATNYYEYSDPVHHKLSGVNCHYINSRGKELNFQGEYIGSADFASYTFDGDVMCVITYTLSEKGEDLYLRKNDYTYTYQLDPEFGVKKPLSMIKKYVNPTYGDAKYYSYAYLYDDLNRLTTMIKEIYGNYTMDFYEYYKNTPIVTHRKHATVDETGAITYVGVGDDYTREIKIENGNLTGTGLGVEPIYR